MSEGNSETFVSVDIEADGPIPGEYSMLSLGAAIVDSPDKTFYVELKPIAQRYDPSALQVARLDRNALKKSGTDPREAMQQFATWIRSTCGATSPVFVGFNAPFDWSFVNYYFHRYHKSNPFGHSALDVKAYYLGILGKRRWSDATKVNLEPEFRAATPHTHHALDDAVEQAAIFRKLRALPQSRRINRS